MTSKMNQERFGQPETRWFAGATQLDRRESRGRHRTHWRRRRMRAISPTTRQKVVQHVHVRIGGAPRTHAQLAQSWEGHAGNAAETAPVGVEVHDERRVILRRSGIDARQLRRRRAAPLQTLAIGRPQPANETRSAERRQSAPQAFVQLA